MVGHVLDGDTYGVVGARVGPAAEVVGLDGGDDEVALDKLVSW